MLISFSGLDCAGKSTQISLLKEYLQGKGYEVSEVWSRGGYTPGIETMKKILRTLLLFAGVAFAGAAQKFALIDMEYILKNVPAYEMANEQLNQLSQRWQKEVEASGQEADAMYKQYLSDKVFLTEEQVKKREEEIVKKEQIAATTNHKHPIISRNRWQHIKKFVNRSKLHKPSARNIHSKSVM